MTRPDPIRPIEPYGVDMTARPLGRPDDVARWREIRRPRILVEAAQIVAARLKGKTLPLGQALDVEAELEAARTGPAFYRSNPHVVALAQVIRSGERATRLHPVKS